VAAKINSSRADANKEGRRKKAERDSSGSRLSVFKGREANLNRAIFAILAKEGPKSIVELQRQLSKRKGLHGTYYASVSKRIRSLEEAGYIRPIICPGSKATLYKLHGKAYLATFLDKKSMEDLLRIITDRDALIVLSDLIYAFLANQNNHRKSHDQKLHITIKKISGS
jgi:DNA-binding Lrp family transcriptional regulator